MLTWDVCSKSTTGVYVCKHTIVLMQGGSEEACKRQAQQEQRKKQREIDLITAKLALDTKLYEAGLRRDQQLGQVKLQSSAKQCRHEAKVAAVQDQRRQDEVRSLLSRKFCRRRQSCVFLDSNEN